MPAFIFGIPAETITAIGTVALAVATFWLAYTATSQLPLLKQQLAALSEEVKLAREADEAEGRRNLENGTLRVCERYVSDQVVYGATKRIWDAASGGKDYGSAANFGSHDLIITLNYLDGIAVGVKQGVYSAAIVKDHMESTFTKITDVVLPAVVPRVIPDTVGYEAIIELRNSWRPVANLAYRQFPPKAGV